MYWKWLRLLIEVRVPPHCATNECWECVCHRVQGFPCWVTCQFVVCKVGTFLSCSARWGSRHSPSAELTNSEAILFPNLKVTFPFVLHILSCVHYIRGVFWHSALRRSICYPALWFPSSLYPPCTRTPTAHTPGSPSAEVTCYQTFH